MGVAASPPMAPVKLCRLFWRRTGEENARRGRRARIILACMIAGGMNLICF